MGFQEYLDLCRDIRSRILANLEKKDSDSLRFATKNTAEKVLESHYLRLFFRSFNDHSYSITEDEFIQRVQSRRLQKFVAIIVFASCSIHAAKTFTAKLAAAARWPLPKGQARIRDRHSLPADRDSLAEFFGGDNDDADKFFGKQAIFCAVVLRQREETIVRDRETQRLPYLEEELVGTGSFGRVFKVKIAAGHIEDRSTDEVSNKAKWVARKDYIIGSPTRNGSQDETEIMNMILSASKTCENILENLGTLRVESALGAIPETYSLFMPLAACDLNAYMKKDSSSTVRAPKARANLIRSAMGLAAGLNFLHHELQTSNLEDVVCYHMDLKPSNILVFHDLSPGQEPRSIWKLSDFGMSRVKIRRRNYAQHEERDFRIWFRPRRQVNEEAPSGTQNRRGQGTYLPRESFLSGKVMNTKSDVWSLGCILSVVFAYLEGGADSIAKYSSDRLKDRKGSDDGFDGFFWERSFGKFSLHHAVIDWHRQLAKKAGIRSLAERKAVHAVLSFLEHNALNMEQDKRCTANGVEKALKEAMDAYRNLEKSQELEEPEKTIKLPSLKRFYSKPPETRIPNNHRFQQWRVARDAHDTLKGCKISPNGTILVYWSDHQLLLFTSLSAPPEHEETLIPAGQFLLGASAFFWKAVALTERYLVATTTGGTLNCYTFDLEAGESVDADLNTCYHTSLPFPEVDDIAISPDHQVLICTLRNMENERLKGCLFQAQIADIIDAGQRVTAEDSDWGSNRTKTPLNFQSPVELMWPAEDIISISLHNQTDGYMVVRPELTDHDVHKVSIVHFSSKTRKINAVDLIPQGLDTNTATLFTDFSELHQSTGCVAIARERNLYKLDFPNGPSLNKPSHLHKTIDKYRILKIMVSQKNDKLFALGTKRANHRIILLEISMPNAKDPLSVKEVVQLPQLFDYDEFTVRLVCGETSSHILIAALAETNRFAVHKVILSNH